MFFKRELVVTTSISHKSRILQILSDQNIKYFLKTDDSFGGGLYSQRRMTGSYGMDASNRFTYHIFVLKKDYEKAAALLSL